VADDDEILLPEPDDRQAILDALAGLVTRRGYEHLALAPLIQPDAKHFPDKWAGGEASVRRVALRLMLYADLDLEPRVVVEDDVGLGPMSPVGVGSAGWFYKMDAGQPVIKVRESSLRDPFVLVPALARAVTAAFRVHHGLALRDPEQEERFVDLTAIYLGFGLVTLPAVIRHHTTRTGARPRSAVSRVGAVDPRALSFALAIVLAVRGTDARGRKAIRAVLGDNPAAFIAAADAWLATLKPPLLERLGIPDRATWPDPPALSQLTAPLPEDDPAMSQEQRRDEEKGVTGMNAGKPVFRVERSKALRMAKLLGLPVLLLGMLFGRAQMGIEIEMWKAASLAAVLALVGLAIGRLLPDARCSEPRCNETLSPEATTCPRCGGTIAGVIHHPRERLAAEDALARSAANAPTQATTDSQ
jgi:hypothetical protein